MANLNVEELPLVLAGPILRRTEPNAVTVWVALKGPRTVTLRVYEPQGQSGGDPVVRLEETASTVALGEYLHLVAVTAKPTTLDETGLEQGKVYYYNLFFQPVSSSDPVPDDPELGLNGPTIVAMTEPRGILSYENTALPLPSFALPPDDLNSLRIVHASCRKPHGEGLDALPGVDHMIATTATDPLRRPHHLFLTGDQIYADDVADPLLRMLIDAGSSLVWGANSDEAGEAELEVLPGIEQRPSMLKPGQRKDVSMNAAKLTSGEAKSHLMGIAEFYMMYLFAWSPVLWPEELPAFEVLYPGQKKTIPYDTFWGEEAEVEKPLFQLYRKETRWLETFRQTLPQVRRALANVPVYMIFDDHEITDDWYLHLHWCVKVLKAPLGRRVMVNGMLAYALFQAWGNTPVQFVSAPGWDLLQAAQQWRGTPAQTMTLPDAGGQPVLEKKLYGWLGFPAVPALKTDRRLDPVQSDAVRWHYRLDGPGYRVIVLDTRTRRAFPPFDSAPKKNRETPPELVHAGALAEQIGLDTLPALTLVVSAAPVLGVPLIDSLQDMQAFFSVVTADYEAWRLQRAGFERLLARLGTQMPTSGDGSTRRGHAVLLSGDVHYAYSVRLQYQAARSFEDPDQRPVDAVFTQLTASSLKNEDWKTRVPHARGYEVNALNIFDFDWWKELPDPELWAGWPEPVADTPLVRPVPMHAWKVFHQRPAMLYLNKVRMLGQFTEKPHWRYRVDYLLAENEVREPAAFSPQEVQAPPPGDRQKALAQYLAAARNHDDYARKWGDGKEIVGVNNVGEVSFQWPATEADRAVVHELWWRLESQRRNDDDPAALLNLFPLTKFVVPLAYNDADYPMPEVP